MNAEEFIEDFLAHRAEYDPIKAREYYLRTRELKGREKGNADPDSKMAFTGDPVVIKPGKRMEEDESPMKSPSGAKLVDYDGKGLGKATYADGSVFTSSGWSRSGKSGTKGKSSVARARRIGAAEQRIIRAKTAAAKVKDPVAREKMVRRIAVAERKLKTLIAQSAKVPKA